MIGALPRWLFGKAELFIRHEIFATKQLSKVQFSPEQDTGRVDRLFRGILNRSPSIQ